MTSIALTAIAGAAAHDTMLRNAVLCWCPTCEPKSPIVRPPGVALPELVAGLPQREVRPQVGERERLTRQRVDGVALQALNDGRALIRMPVLSDDRVVHDLEGDVVY